MQVLHRRVDVSVTRHSSSGRIDTEHLWGRIPVRVLRYGGYANFWIPMPRGLKITDNLVQIFNMMLERPGKSWYGLELADAAGIGSATIYHALTRMERAGMLRARWEPETASELGRPQRRLYDLTPEGARVGREAVSNYRPRVRIAPERAGWLPGPQISEGSS